MRKKTKFSRPKKGELKSRYGAKIHLDISFEDAINICAGKKKTNKNILKEL